MINVFNTKEVQDLFKALNTNNFAQAYGIEGQTGGAAFIPESLENTLRTLSYTEDQLRLWKNIKKDKAFSTVEEYNVINDYGADLSAFQAEGLAGIDTIGNYSREFGKVKCLNTTRAVTHLMTMVKTTDDPEAVETQSGMRYLLKQAEQALFYGDSSLAADGREGLEWDGIMKQAHEGNTIDLKGDYLDDKVLNNASETILNNYGRPTSVYMPIQVSSKFSEQYYPEQRALMNVQPGTITAGTVVTQFNSVGGTIDIEPDVFMRKGIIPLNPNEPAVGDKAPTPPTVAVALDATVEDATHEVGTYKYAVVAYSNGGKSVAVESTAIAVTDEDKAKGIKLTITNSNVQINAPDFFIIYRTEKNGDQYFEIARVGAETSEKSGKTEFVDKNEVLPNTATAIVGDFRDESVVFKQLAPMFKLDYAITQPMKRFGIFLYGLPIVYAPKRFVVIKNIKHA